MSAESRPPELDKLFEGDGYLRTHESDLLLRWNKFAQLERSIEANEGGLAQVAFSYKQYGIVQRENGDVEVCEWVPNAESVAVVGDFNDWNETSHVCTKDDFAKFRLTIPALSGGKSPIPHKSVVKLLIMTKDGQKLWRMSPWTKYAVQVEEVSMDYQPRHWNPEDGGYQWRYERPGKPKSMRITLTLSTLN